MTAFPLLSVFNLILCCALLSMMLFNTTTNTVMAPALYYCVSRTTLGASLPRFAHVISSVISDRQQQTEKTEHHSVSIILCAGFLLLASYRSKQLPDGTVHNCCCNPCQPPDKLYCPYIVIDVRLFPASAKRP